MPSNATGTPLPIKLSNLRKFEGQPRRHFSATSIASLAASIKEEGQETPVSVVMSKTEPGTFVLIDGERRMRAFQLIAEDTNTDPIILAFVDVVKDLEDHFRKSTIANLHREDMPPLDTGAALARLKKTKTLEQLADMTGKSVTYVKNYISLEALPEEVKDMMSPDRSKENRLNVSQAIEIARVPNKVLQIDLAKESLERGLGMMETRNLAVFKSSSRGYVLKGIKQRNTRDDYRVIAGLPGRIEKTLRRVDEMYIDDIFFDRDDEVGDRAKMAKRYGSMIEHLQKIKDKIETPRETAGDRPNLSIVSN